MSNKICPCCKRELPATLEYFHKCSSRKDGLFWRCKECHSEMRKPVRNSQEGREKSRIYASQWKKDNPEKNRSRQARWSKKHPDIAKAIKRRSNSKNAEGIKNRRHKYYLENAEQFHERNERWRLSHQEQVNQNSAEWRIRNPEKSREISRKYTQNHPDVSRAACARRRARIYGNGGSHTKDDIARLLKAQKNRCYYCGLRLGKDYHVDHIVPLSRGGTNNPDNLAIACPTCNIKKGWKLPHEWAEGGRLL